MAVASELDQETFAILTAIPIDDTDLVEGLVDTFRLLFGASPVGVTAASLLGDLVNRPIVADLSTSLASMVERSPGPVSAAAALVHGFQQYMPIPIQQLELLYGATLARAIMTVQLLEFRVRNTDPDSGIASVDLPNAKTGLRKLLRVDDARLLDAVQRPAEFLSEPMEAG